MSEVETAERDLTSGRAELEHERCENGRLREQLADARRRERERCAKAASCGCGFDTCPREYGAAAIRALGDEG